MFKMICPNTAIRIKRLDYKKDSEGNPITVDENGHKVNKEYVDLLDEDILCEWQNKFGSEAIRAAAESSKDPAVLRMWYIPGVAADCKIVRVEDGAEYEIIGTPDDVKNRHQQLEIQIRRFTGGR